jgi:hypothetical protein
MLDVVQIVDEEGNAGDAVEDQKQESRNQPHHQSGHVVDSSHDLITATHALNRAWMRTQRCLHNN